MIKFHFNQPFFAIKQCFVNEDRHETITALNPIARQALLGYHGQDLTSSLAFVAELVLTGNQPH